MIGLEADVGDAVGMLGAVVDRIENPRPALQEIASLMGDYTREVFDTSAGGQWPGLDADTIRIKGSSRVMVDTGQLLEALTSPVVVDGDTIAAPAPEYAKYPARRRDPAPTPPGQVVDQWSQVLADHIVEGRT